MLIAANKSVQDTLYCKACGSPYDIDLHHKLKKSSVSENTIITDKEGRQYYRNSWRNLAPLCHSCHLYKVHANPTWAKENGLIETRNK